MITVNFKSNVTSALAIRYKRRRYFLIIQDQLRRCVDCVNLIRLSVAKVNLEYIVGSNIGRIFIVHNCVVIWDLLFKCANVVLVSDMTELKSMCLELVLNF